MTNGASSGIGTVDGVKTVTYRGRTHTLREWASIRDIKVVTLHTRYDNGWSAAEVLGYRPRPRRRGRTVTHEGQTRTIGDWARILKVSPSSMHARYVAGYRPAQILGLEPIDDAAYFLKKAAVYTRSDGLGGTLKEWSDFLGRPWNTLDARIRRGWSIDRALELPGAEAGVGAAGTVGASCDARVGKPSPVGERECPVGSP